jgi:AmmeMemoRadiSam system protein B
MSLVFSAITPHPPIIVPTVAPEEINLVKKTVQAMKEMEGDMYVSQPDVIFIISPHSLITQEAFSLNLANEFKSNLSEVGFKEKELSYKCEIELLSKIKEEAVNHNMPVNIISQPILDHGACVPLYYLTQHLPNIKIIPISYSLLNFEKHVEFGNLLKKVAFESNKRVAIIASGDLSHRLTKDAPAGFSPQGKTFDELLVKYLEENKVKDILKMNLQLIDDAGECGFRSILIALGSVSNLNYKFKKLSYEGPFGVGYLAAEFALK